MCWRRAAQEGRGAEEEAIKIASAVHIERLKKEEEFKQLTRLRIAFRLLFFLWPFLGLGGFGNYCFAVYGALFILQPRRAAQCVRPGLVAEHPRRQAHVAALVGFSCYVHDAFWLQYIMFPSSL